VQVLGVDKRKKQIKLSMKALQPQAQEIMAEEAAKDEPAPTAMEMALRKAMDKEESPAAAPQTEGKLQKQRDDMENILSRTLENRVKSK
jgi:translation initiation factor 2 alpha subunit (eIF-2alpha)